MRSVEAAASGSSYSAYNRGQCTLYSDYHLIFNMFFKFYLYIFVCGPAVDFIGQKVITISFLRE